MELTVGRVGAWRKLAMESDKERKEAERSLI